MSHESPQPEKGTPPNDFEANEAFQRKERIRAATEKAIELIEREPGFNWLMHLYTSKGYMDKEYDKKTGAFGFSRTDQNQIPIYSMGEEVRRPPFKFYAKVMSQRSRPEYKQIVFWMNLGDHAFTDGNPFLHDPRGSYFASALQVLDSPDVLDKCGDENLKKYLDAFLHGTPDPEAREFMSSLLEVCNSKWQPEYWHWIESLER